MRPSQLVRAFCLSFVGLATAHGAQEEAAPAVEEGHSGHGEAFDEGPRQAAYLMSEAGPVQFPISTEDEFVQAMFNQGIRQLHGFWYFEAERSFRQVAALEPDCALAYWGMAMANRENPKRAAAFAQEAWSRRDLGTERERMYVEGIATLYGIAGAPLPEGEQAQETPDEVGDPETTGSSSEPPAAELEEGSSDSSEDGEAAVEGEQQPAEAEDSEPGEAQRTIEEDFEPEQPNRLAFLKNLEAIVAAYPDDLEAKAFLINQYWHFESDHRLSQKKRERILDKVLGPHPDHPAQHYRIHLWDKKKTIEQAISSVALVGPSSPSVAHNWHMGGHVLDKLKRYADAAWQQEASARVDHAHMMRDLILPDQIHNFAHNNEWLIRSLRSAGRGREAVALAKNMIELPRHPKWNGPDIEYSSARYGHERLRETIEMYELWEVALELASSPYLVQNDSEENHVERLYLQGKAHAILGDEAALEEVLYGLEDLAQGAKQSRDRREADARHATLIALTEMLAGQGVADALEVLQEEGFDESLQTWLLADVGEYELAENLARKLARDNPGRVLPLANYAYALEKARKREQATEVFEDLRALSTGIDLDVRAMQRIAPLASALGYPEDWRKEFELPADLGPRVDLDSLGPAVWSPPAAPAWKAIQPDGQAVSSADYSGGVRILILFLGLGCVHCVEQLNAFAPYVDTFRRAGIEMVTIGDDTPEALDEADVVSSYPFPVLSDAEYEVFHTYRSYDDFEDLPLHGTFLIDADDRILWMDVGAEPFTDAQYLLEEAERLLAMYAVSPNSEGDERDEPGEK